MILLIGVPNGLLVVKYAVQHEPASGHCKTIFARWRHAAGATPAKGEYVIGFRPARHACQYRDGVIALPKSGRETEMPRTTSLFNATLCVGWAIALSACSGQDRPPGPREYLGNYSNGNFIASTAFGCGARDHQYLVGQDAAAVSASNLPFETRMIFPASVENQSYDPQRVTVRIDAAGRVSQVFCG